MKMNSNTYKEIPFEEIGGSLPALQIADAVIEEDKPL